MRRLPALAAAGLLAVSLAACTGRAPDVKFDPGKPLYTEAPAPARTAAVDDCAGLPPAPVHHAVCDGTDTEPAPAPAKTKAPKTHKAAPHHKKGAPSPDDTPEDAQP